MTKVELMNHQFSGVHAALVTPFTKKGEIDWNALSELIALQKLDGLHGIVMAGSTGESPTLSITERVELIKFTKLHAGPMKVIAGAGSNCTETAVEYQKAMEEAGADATLQVVPYYNKPTQRGLYEHFSGIAKNASIPVILYNAYGRTGIDLAPSTVKALAIEHKNIVGIKDANTNIERLSDLMRLTKEAREDFTVLCGEDAAFFPFLAMGGHGIIGVVCQIAASEMLTLFDCVKNGDFVYAQKISHKLNGLCKLMFCHPNPIPVKTILAKMGLIEKQWRLPLCGLLENEEVDLLERCKEFSFVKNFKKRGLVS